VSGMSKNNSNSASGANLGPDAARA